MADSLLPQPRNPARMPEGVENFLAQATVEPLWDVAKGVGALATGQGMVPEVGAGIFGAMGLLSPMKAGALTKGIRAYHGSPHKFAPEPGAPLGRFSMDKIGTGEGAQAYGHGLYFAENEGVAKAYRDQLTGGALSTPEMLAKQVLESGDTAQSLLTKARSERGIGTAAADFNADNFERAAELLKQGWKPPGHMYEVNINARPEQFLDWDRPLSGQGNDVLPKVLGELQPYIRQLEGDLKSATLGKPRIQQELSDLQDGAKNITGERLLRMLGANERASSTLREAGIPGIKYLDQGSRTQVDDPATVLRNVERAQTQVDRARQSGDQEWLSRAQNDLMQWSKDYDLVTGKAKGTKNYVVFDDKLIDILKRYGIAGAGLSGLIAANQGDFGYQPKAPLNDTVAAAAYQ